MQLWQPLYLFFFAQRTNQPDSKCTSIPKASTKYSDAVIHAEVGNQIQQLVDVVADFCTPLLNLLDEELEMAESVQSQIDEQKINAGKPGPVPLYLQFPTIVDVATEFLALNGMAAEKRRRNDIAFCSGTTLEQMREHLLQNVPGLAEKGISEKAVHLFKPI